jgi:putative transposase
MPIKRPNLVNNEIYHVVSRVNGDGLLFKDVDDYYRGIFSIYEFNNSKPVEIWLRRLQRKKEKLLGETFSQYADNRNKVVEVLAFCLMPNHIHLLLRQLQDDGITKFMRKFGAGYASHFNKKYSCKGHLFQGRFKPVLIKDDNQLKIVFVYIHTNPVALIEPNWKEKGVGDTDKIIEFLESYKWSSYQDYIGGKNFQSVTQRDFLLETMGGLEGCMEYVKDWIRHKKELRDSWDVNLE